MSFSRRVVLFFSIQPVQFHALSVIQLRILCKFLGQKGTSFSFLLRSIFDRHAFHHDFFKQQNENDFSFPVTTAFRRYICYSFISFSLCFICHVLLPLSRFNFSCIDFSNTRTFWFFVSFSRYDFIRALFFFQLLSSISRFFFSFLAQVLKIEEIYVHVFISIPDAARYLCFPLLRLLSLDLLFLPLPSPVIRTSRIKRKSTRSFSNRFHSIPRYCHLHGPFHLFRSISSSPFSSQSQLSSLSLSLFLSHG